MDGEVCRDLGFKSCLCIYNNFFLFGKKKGPNLYRTHRRPTGAIKVVDYSMNP